MLAEYSDEDDTCARLYCNEMRKRAKDRVSIILEAIDSFAKSDRPIHVLIGNIAAKAINLLCKIPHLPLSLLLSQRESLVTVKFFDSEMLMIFNISELPPESKYAFSRKCMCVCMCVCV